MKNMTGTLNKSDNTVSATAVERRYDSHLHQTKDDTASASSTSLKPEMGRIDAAYKRDYDRVSQTTSDRSAADDKEGVDRLNHLTKLYEDMDRMADVVLYEIDITERRYSKLLEDYKGATPSSREVISKELDFLSSMQVTLYKAYVSIYKRGRSEWTRVKSEVDATLLRLRGVSTKQC